RIGASGDPIFIGTSTTFTAPTGGEVWLGVNDNDPGNNAGGFVVNVCLGQAPAPDPESNWTVDDITPLKGQIAGVVPDAGNVGEITGEPGLSDPTTDKEKIEAQIAEIEKLPDKEREKYRDELAQLYDQLYLVNRHEELDWMLAEGLITVTDKSMGLIPKTALVWGISTGLTTLIMGDFEDGMNRLIGAIPWKNIGTAYSVILDAHSLLRPDGPGYRYQASQSPLVVLPPVP
ncbi:hypothetical protein KA005_63860, partial [bacterium]|nr:hypothetical protein [bacterium]